MNSDNPTDENLLRYFKLFIISELLVYYALNVKKSHLTHPYIKEGMSGFNASDLSDHNKH